MISNNASVEKDSRTTWPRIKLLLNYAKKPVVGALAIILSDLTSLFIVIGAIPKPTIILVLFFEGGLGLLAGSAIMLSSTPSITKIGEMTFGTASWSREGERNAEKVGGKWILGSSLVILLGFALSSI